MADSESPEERQKRQEPPPLEFMRPGEQPPPAPSSQPPAAWVPRPEDFQRPTYPQGPPSQAAAGQLHLYAGVALLLAAVSGIGYTIYLSVQFLSPSDYANLTKNITPTLYALGQVCALFGIWAEAAALLGGVMAIQRLNWKLAVGCGIFATLAAGAEFALFLDPFLGLFALLCLVGFAMAYRARREFLS